MLPRPRAEAQSSALARQHLEDLLAPRIEDLEGRGAPSVAWRIEEPVPGREVQELLASAVQGGGGVAHASRKFY
jgi:hypothetical protein